MLATKVYLIFGTILIFFLSWANLRGYDVLDNIFPKVQSGRYTRTGFIFHK